MQTVASGCEGFPTFRDLTPFPSLGCAGGFGAPNPMTSCQTGRVGHLVTSCGDTIPPAKPENGEGVKSRNVGKPSPPDAAVCPRKVSLNNKQPYK